MRFIIAGVDVAEGRMGDDARQGRPYFELGWEAVSTHFDVKRGKYEGWLDPARDVVVTCEGRQFLYEAEFSKVISFREFIRTADYSSTIVDLTRPYWGGVIKPAYFVGSLTGRMARSRFIAEHRGLALSVGRRDVKNLHQNESYCCLAVRRRDHGCYRNMSKGRANFIIDRLQSKWTTVFVVGHDVSDIVCRRNVVHVDLATYVSLMAEPQCEVVIGTMTGTMQLAALFSAAKLCVVVLNYDGCDVDEENHPVLMGRCIRASESRFVFVPPSCFEIVFGEWIKTL